MKGKRTFANQTAFGRASIMLVSMLCLLSVGQAKTGRLSNLQKMAVQTEVLSAGSSQEEEFQFRLEQDASTYDGYVPLKVPFTQTDGYLKLDSFLIGLKLDDWYQYSSECINDLVWVIDDKDYFSNNRTLGKSQGNESWIHPLLNLTGAMGGHFADAVPNCYQFQNDVKETERERFNSYEGWGDIMIAFLFNQMGNALEFQQKFTNIQLDKETQNYQGVWMEYGDLIHIIWDFQQLEAGARATFDAIISQYIPDMQFQDMDSPVESYITVTALQRFSDYIDLKADVAAAKIDQTIAQVSHNYQLAANQFNGATDGKRLAYGFMNGAIDVFPYDSLPDLCRDNVTFTRDTVTDLFINSPYVFPDDNLDYVEDISDLLRYPYGLTFSCMFGAQQVFTVRKKVEDTTGFTDAELFANNLIIINDVITNFVFNLGYIYSDVAGYLTLDDVNLNYWTEAGGYAGDFVMRFWYREDFNSEFQFDIIDSCDTTDPDVTCLD